jgi:uncharacterized protein
MPTAFTLTKYQDSFDGMTMQPPLKTFNHFCQSTFGTRLVKITLDIGAPCPHREQPSGGCIFCNPHAFTPDKTDSLPLASQLSCGIKRMGIRYDTRTFAAYFQDNTTTALPVNLLRKALEEVASHPDIRMIFIGTRPDFLPEEMLNLLQEYNELLPVWVELGVQSIHDNTLKSLNRGHDFSCTTAAIHQLQLRGIPVVAHMILGLPGETTVMIQRSLQQLQQLQIAGVKLHHLQVHRDTKLATSFAAGEIAVLSFEDYLDLLCELIPWLPPEAIVFRLFAEAHPDLLLAPKWSMPKAQIFDRIYRRLHDDNIRQGEHY